jgi:predicted Zn-dependent protease
MPKAGKIVALSLWLGMAAASTASDPATTDEAALTLDRAARDLVSRIERSGALYGRDSVDAYLQRIALGLLGPDEAELAKQIRVRALKGANINAFALPNGAIFVTTGLLAALENEAQLASVLAHELTHFTEAHALKQRRSTGRKSAWTRGLTILFAAAIGASVGDPGVAAPLAGLTRDVGELMLLASVSGYSRELEREADQQGFERLLAAGYAPSEAVEVFEKLLTAADPEDADASAYFASHPRLTERLASYEELAGARPAGDSTESGRVGQDEYRAQLPTIRLDHLEVLIESGAFAAARASFAHLESIGPLDARGHFLKGEHLRRERASPSSARDALIEYERAAALPDAPAEAWRQAGMIHRVDGNHDAAVRAFRRYLELAPQAADAPLVRAYLHRQSATEATAPPCNQGEVTCADSSGHR